MFLKLAAVVRIGFDVAEGGARVGKIWAGVAHAVRTATNITVKVKRTAPFIVFLLTYYPELNV
jgi:hypothetical protein